MILRMRLALVSHKSLYFLELEPRLHYHYLINYSYIRRNLLTMYILRWAEGLWTEVYCSCSANFYRFFRMYLLLSVESIFKIKTPCSIKTVANIPQTLVRWLMTQTSYNIICNFPVVTISVRLKISRSIKLESMLVNYWRLKFLRKC